MKGPREHLLELLLFLLVNGGPLRVRGHPVDGRVVRRVGHPGDETSHTHTPFFTGRGKSSSLLERVSVSGLCRSRRDLKPSPDDLTQ